MFHRFPSSALAPFRGVLVAGLLLCGLPLAFAASEPLAVPVSVAATTASATALTELNKSPADAPAEESVQVLVFADGDRTRGKLLRREGDVLVFHSDRFGELRVPAASAKVIGESMPVVAKRPAPTPVADVPVKVAPTAPDTGWARWTSPVQLAELLNDIFGHWHGRFSMASSLVSGSSETRSVSGEVKLQRKWKRDEVNLTGRYDFGETSDRTTSDLLKTTGSWRHQLTGRVFATYRPTLEWNRSAVKAGRQVDYVLLQQELGAGVTLYNRPAFKLRLGLAESRFDNWQQPDDLHIRSNKESVFSELEWKLPWRGTLTDRGSWYYSLHGEAAGWENLFELSKKFSDTLSLSLRHDIRRKATAEKVEDYALWRVLVGFDF